mmetsp:Transcript_79213/g.183813  ORF Transcript_79213/g.183813 Transcript_79213/m.183813 type:complete len:264 (+) Transcript_79213:66-857(+)
MSLEKLGAELERALERLQRLEESSDHQGAEASRASAREPTPLLPRSNSSEPRRRHVSKEPVQCRPQVPTLQLPRRTLALEPHRGREGCLGIRLDGPALAAWRSREDLELCSLSTVSTPLSAHGSTHISEASDRAATSSPSRGYATPPSESTQALYDCSDRSFWHEVDSAASLAPSLTSCSTLAHCSSGSSFASSCGPVTSPALARSDFGWALGSSLAPCHGEIRPYQEPAAAAPEVDRARRRSVLAQLAGCLYRIEEIDDVSA